MPAAQPGVTLHALTDIDPRLEVPLLALFAAQGVSERYWTRVKPAFAAGPALLFVAIHGRWPVAKPAHDVVRGAMYALPADSETVELSMPVIDARHKADSGLLCALWKTALERLAAAGMQRLRYGLDANAPYLANWLTRTGLGFVHPTPQALMFEASISTLIDKLQLGDLTIDDSFGTSPRHDLAAQFAMTMRMLGNAFPFPRLVVVNPAARVV